MAHHALFFVLLGSIGVMGFEQDRNRGWKPSSPTPTRTVEMSSDRWAHLRVSPRPTDALNLVQNTILNLKREEFGTDTCGFFPENGAPLTCAGASVTCTNFGDYRGCCFGNMCSSPNAQFTHCLNLNDPLCHTPPPGQFCCGTKDPTTPFCVTYFWSTVATPNRIFTLFNCAMKEWAGNGILDAEPRIFVTGNSSTTQATPSTSALSAPASTDATSSSNTAAPVGAIVGGVLAGLVVIGAVVLGVFFMFFRNRRRASWGSYTPAKTEPEGPPGYDSRSMASPPLGAPTGQFVHLDAPHSVSAISSVSGSTVVNSPPLRPHAESDPTKMQNLSVASRPVSREVSTSPSPTEMGTFLPAVELPNTERATVELP